MTTITFKNQYSNYNSPTVNKAAGSSEVAATNTLPNEKPNGVKGQTFLEGAQEALFYQRLGVNKDKIDELKATIEELTKELQGQGADPSAIANKIEELQKMLEQEYQKGRERTDMQDEHEPGKIISAFV
jgi:predicted RNase H-like nuclease (RuvC/YqgF family)